MPTEKRGDYDHPDAGIYKINPDVPDKVDDRYQIRLRNPAGGYFKETVNGRMHARERMSEVRNELRGGGMAPSAERRKQTVRDVLDGIVRSKNIAPKTMKQYRQTLHQHVYPKMGHLLVSALEGRELFLTGFFSEVEHRAGRQARRQVEMHVRTLLRYATRNGLLNRNPLDGVRWVKPGYVRGVPFCPVTEDLHRVRTGILDAATNGSRPGEREMTLAFIDSLAGLGLRVGEAAAIGDDSIDKARGMFNVTRQVLYLPLTPEEKERGITRPLFVFAPAKTDESRTTGSGAPSGDRRVPIPSFVTAAWATTRLRNGVREIKLPFVESAFDLDPTRLDDLRYETHPLLFFSLREGREDAPRLGFGAPGNQPFGTAALQRRLAASGTRLELSGALHPHCYRHYYTTMLSEAGVPQRIIDYVTGHVPRGVTNRVYTHVTDPGLEAARKAIEAAWGTPGQDAQEGISISS